MDEDPALAAQPSPAWAGVVLAGGGAVRMDGIDKSAVEIAGRTLLEHALAALADLPEVVVVGPEVPTARPVTFTREDPSGGCAPRALAIQTGPFSSTGGDSTSARRTGPAHCSPPLPHRSSSPVCRCTGWSAACASVRSRPAPTRPATSTPWRDLRDLSDQDSSDTDPAE